MSLLCATKGFIDHVVDEDKAGIAASDSSGPVYQQGWWLDIARGQSDLRESRVLKDGKLVGTLSYIQTRSVVSRMIPLSFSFGGRAHWTSFCQPDLDAALEEGEKSEVLHRLVRKLPRKISFKFVVAPDAKDRELIKDAFKAAGFEHTIQPTYSERPADIVARTRVSAKHRYNLRRAERDLEVLGTKPSDPAISAAAFVDFYQKNLGPGEKSHASLDIARALIEESQKRHQGQVFVARRKRTSGNDTNSCWDAAIACVWDASRLYYWMSSRRREDPNNTADRPHEDAIKLLMTTAISHARSIGRIFDADGVPTVNGCPDQGKNDLYKKIVKLPDEENRDVYYRPSRLYRAFTQLRQKLRGPVKKIVARFGMYGTMAADNVGGESAGSLIPQETP
ncbi:MAG: GNAT family N-acetyltransferase [Verrucomicrobia bacterium]|nr:GNAT family N-acetyltransferase [Verrucomicrobiota bacterium]